MFCCCTKSLRGGEGETTDASSRPLNFLFIVVDDLGYSDLACYGGDLHETPNIDRFATQGVRFTDAYAAAPVCSPTRASIMTGKYPARLHMTIWYEASNNPPQNRKLIPPVTIGNLPHAETTIAEVLQATGYFTAHIGKWHLGDAAHYPQTQGFDVNIGGTFWGAPPTYFYPYRGKWSQTEEIRYVPHLEWGSEGEYLTDRLTDEAIRTIERARDRPFFLHLAYHTVHTPIEAKEVDANHYQQKIRPGLHHTNPVYAAMVHSMDENVGRLLAKLDELGIADDTVVVLTSDNGGYVNDYRGTVVTDNYPLRSGKGSLYEGGVRVPLVVRAPGVTTPGTTCRVPIISTDFYPTVLEMANLAGDPEHNRDVDGKSLLSLLKDPSEALARDALYFHYPHYYPTTTPVGSVRAGAWKLLEYYEDGHVELYNLADDLGETNNLAESMPRRADKLRGQLASWREAVDAQMPAVNPARQSSAAR